MWELRENKSLLLLFFRKEELSLNCGVRVA
jgi:hypothetical protein